MGHDTHFLRRLDRVSDNHVEISLALYRDEELLREVLSRAELPPGAERLAISLNHPTDGPFIIVTHTGRFVTCLGEGMKIGSDLVVVTRPRLDAAIAKVERMRERVARVTALIHEGKDGTAQRLFRKLGDDGLLFSREDAGALLEFWPLIGREAGMTLTELVKSIARFRSTFLPLRFDRLAPVERKMVLDYGKLVWAASNLVVLTTEVESSEYFDELSAARDIDARAVVWGAIFGLGTFTHSTRALWSLGQRRKRGLDTLGALRSLDDLQGHTMRELGLGVLAISTPKMRTEAIEELTREPTETLPADAPLAEKRRYLLQKHASYYAGLTRTVLEDEAAADASYLEYGREVACLMKYPFASEERHVVLRDAIPEDIARAAVPAVGFSWLDDGVMKLPNALPFLARAKATDLFLPRAFTQGIPPTDENEVEWMVKGYKTWYGLNPKTVQNEAPKVGRNDPCSCGSGKKFKRCCAP